MFLTALYSRYMERTGIKENPYSIRRLKQTVSERHVAFTDMDRLRIEEYLQKHYPELFIFTRLLYLAFIRLGELRNIKIGDISEDRTYITINGLVAKNSRTETAQIITPLRNVLMGEYFQG